MRKSAFILIFPLALFLAETISFIPAMQEACSITPAGKSSCGKKQEQSSCHKKKIKNTCAQNRFQDECMGKQDKKPASKNCENKPGCSSCPVCYNFIFQPQYEWQATRFYVSKNYGLLYANYTSVYTPNVWKPPNGFM